MSGIGWQVPRDMRDMHEFMNPGICCKRPAYFLRSFWHQHQLAALCVAAIAAQGLAKQFSNTFQSASGFPPAVCLDELGIMLQVTMSPLEVK